MKQFHLNGRELTLTVKRAPLFIRGMLFLFAFLSFIMPLVGMILYMAFGYGFHFGFLIGLFIFGLLGFYLLRVALWNTLGIEILVFSKFVFHQATRLRR
ncbi:MAG: SoxR reducing system RseC family protein [Flavobacteriales bacterium]|nr:SoxR reducing system RseC family protein [Flavobacteriales bacterium]